MRIQFAILLAILLAVGLLTSGCGLGIALHYATLEAARNNEAPEKDRLGKVPLRPTRVPGTEDRRRGGRAGPGEHDGRVLGVNGQRPNVKFAQGRVH